MTPLCKFQITRYLRLMFNYTADPRIVVKKFFPYFWKVHTWVGWLPKIILDFGHFGHSKFLILRFFSSNIGNLRNQESCHNAWLVQLSWIIFSPIMSLLGVHVLKKKKFQISKILLNKIFQNSDFQKRSKKSAWPHPEGQFFSTMGKLTT